MKILEPLHVSPSPLSGSLHKGVFPASAPIGVGISFYYQADF